MRIRNKIDICVWQKSSIKIISRFSKMKFSKENNRQVLKERFDDYARTERRSYRHAVSLIAGINHA